MSKLCGDFYCLNCLHSRKTINKLKSHKIVCENKDFCNVIMPSKDIIKLEFNQINIKNRISFQKSDKAPFVIYANLECLIEKIDRCINSVEHLFTTKVGEPIPSGFSMSTISSFKNKENKHDVYRGQDCMKIFLNLLKSTQ